MAIGHGIVAVKIGFGMDPQIARQLIESCVILTRAIFQKMSKVGDEFIYR